MTGKFWGLEEAPPIRDATERPRKNTIERFNDELSVLERPLEGDVEYYDEAPPSARWRKLSAFVLVAGLTVCASLIVTRHLRARAAVAQPSPAQAPIAEPARTAPAVAAPTLAPLSSSDRRRAAQPALAATGDAPAARTEARSADADSVKATHRSRHARHHKSASHHHERHR